MLADQTANQSFSEPVLTLISDPFCTQSLSAELVKVLLFVLFRFVCVCVCSHTCLRTCICYPAGICRSEHNLWEMEVLSFHHLGSELGLSVLTSDAPTHWAIPPAWRFSFLPQLTLLQLLPFVFYFIPLAFKELLSLSLVLRFVGTFMEGRKIATVNYSSI